MASRPSLEYTRECSYMEPLRSYWLELNILNVIGLGTGLYPPKVAAPECTAVPLPYLTLISF